MKKRVKFKVLKFENVVFTKHLKFSKKLVISKILIIEGCFNIQSGFKVLKVTNFNGR